MQKIVILNMGNCYVGLGHANKSLEDDGWKVKSFKIKDKYAVFVLEKFTRKEKLEHLKDLNDE